MSQDEIEKRVLEKIENNHLKEKIFSNREEIFIKEAISLTIAECEKSEKELRARLKRYGLYKQGRLSAVQEMFQEIENKFGWWSSQHHPKLPRMMRILEFEWEDWKKQKLDQMVNEKVKL